MTALSPDIIACAIVAAGRVCKQDPEIAYRTGGRARYYAVKLLRRFAPEAGKNFLAECVGYSRYSGSSMLSPSMERQYSFNGKLFDRAWLEFNRLLERFAPQALEAESSSSPPAIVPPPLPRPARPPRQNSEPLILAADPDTARIVEKSRMSSMIEEAFANTPGARKV